MKTTVDHISETKVKLTIELEKSELKSAEEIALVHLGKSLKAPGFRKGKAPLSVVAKNVSPTALTEETIDRAINKAIIVAFTKEDLRPLDRPEVEITKFVPGDVLVFTAETEVLPPIELGDYKKLKLTKPKAIKIEDKEVDEILTRIRTDLAEKKTVERAAAMKDEVIIDFEGKINDVAFDGGKAEGYALTLGSESFIPGFEEAIVGHTAGETFDVKVSFPKEYHVKDLAGKKATFTTTLKEVKEVVLHELNDALAEKAGPFKTLDDLKKEIIQGMTAKHQQEQYDAARDEAVKALVAKSKVAVPEVLRADQLKSVEQDLTQNLMYRGMTFEQYLESEGYKSREEWQEKEANAAADERVKAGLLLVKLADELDITVSEADLEAKILEYKQQYGGNPKMAERFNEKSVQQNILSNMRTEAAIEKLIELNTK